MVGRWNFLLGRPIFRGHVSFREGRKTYIPFASASRGCVWMWLWKKNVCVCVYMFQGTIQHRKRRAKKKTTSEPGKKPYLFLKYWILLILIVYYNPYITGQYNPPNNPTNPVFSWLIWHHGWPDSPWKKSPKTSSFVSKRKLAMKRNSLIATGKDDGTRVTCDTTNPVTCSSHKCDAKMTSLVAIQPLKNKKK